jgi:hypothetical protein
MLGNDRGGIYAAIRAWKGSHMTPDQRLKLDRFLDTIDREPRK